MYSYRFGSEVVFQTCCKMVSPKQDTLAVKVKIAMVNYMKVIITGPVSCISNCNSICIVGALENIIKWAYDTKSPDLRKVNYIRLLYSLFHPIFFSFQLISLFKSLTEILNHLKLFWAACHLLPRFIFGVYWMRKYLANISSRITEKQNHH